MRTRWVLLVLLSASACRDVSPAPPESRLVLPRGGVEFQATQRSTTPHPGSNGALQITLDDITRGQVMLSIATDHGQTVRAPASAREGDVLPFTLDGREYTLTVLALRNALLGDDVGRFRLEERAAAAAVGAAPTTATHPDAAREREKIEQLIAAVASLRDAQFVRNGDAHGADRAAAHLRGKWQTRSREIATARDFIELVATRSSSSGEAYRIRFADGREITAAEFLNQELARIEGAR